MDELLHYQPDNLLHLVRAVGQVGGRDFTAAFEVDRVKVRVTAPILKRFIHGLSIDEARGVIAEEGWTATVVKKQLTEPCIVQHAESFEVQKDGLRAFFLYDDVPSRRAINGRVDAATALAKAQAYLKGA